MIVYFNRWEPFVHRFLASFFACVQWVTGSVSSTVPPRCFWTRQRYVHATSSPIVEHEQTPVGRSDYHYAFFGLRSRAYIKLRYAMAFAVVPVKQSRRIAGNPEC